jgi:outer membrane protein
VRCSSASRRGPLLAGSALAASAWLAVPAAPALAQTGAAPQVFTLEQAIRYAADHYPAVRAAVEQVSASAAGVDVARAAYLPRLDALWQSNRATANNVFGQLLPQSILPGISGPVLPAGSASVWGSATGALFSWEAVDFGLRRATVAGAESAVARARAGEALTRLEVETTVARAFLAVVSAKRAVAALQADVDRRDVLARVVHTLVDNQLRPGADASRADAERAAARTRLILGQQSLALAETSLARVLGIADGAVTVDDGALLGVMPAADLGSAEPQPHPLVQVQQAALDAARAEQRVLARTDLPRLYVQSSVFARGSGASPDGTLDGGVSGLALDRANWAAGVQVVFPNLFDFSSLRARKAAAAASERAEAARYDEAELTVAAGRQSAAVLVRAAREVAANTPVQLAAARQGEAQARARYEAGLASIVEVADAERLLAEADASDQLARVEVWRALLEQAAAAGSLSRFEALLPPVKVP